MDRQHGSEGPDNRPAAECFVGARHRPL